MLVCKVFAPPKLRKRINTAFLFIIKKFCYYIKFMVEKMVVFRRENNMKKITAEKETV